MKINKTIFIICCTLVVVAFGWLYFTLQGEKKLHQLDKQITEDVIKKQYHELNFTIFTANKNIKLSDIRNDSIIRVHVALQKQMVQLNKYLQHHTNEIKTLNINSRFVYVDSVLRSKGIR